jgi:hypothetical protein
MMPEPNWDRIYDIARRAEDIHGSGAMDRDTWRQLLAEASEAANGRPDLTSFLAPYAKGEWIRELRAEEESQARSAA